MSISRRRPAALIGLAAGVLGGLAIVAVWRMPASENATRIAVYFALIGIVITAGPVLMTPRLPPTEAWPALMPATPSIQNVSVDTRHRYGQEEANENGAATATVCPPTGASARGLARPACVVLREPVLYGL